MRRLSAAPAALVLLAALTLAACTPSRYRTSEGAVWSTLFHITYNSPIDLSDSIREVFTMVERSLSPFSEASAITLINRGDTSVVADSLLRRVFSVSREVNRLSDGMFDPTVAPLVNLWGFGYTGEGDADGPDDSRIAEALALVGIDKCSLTADGHIVKGNPATEFNFSAITKGYGCDLVADMLRRNGVDDYMVEIGGEVALSGLNASRRQWRIMIDAPIDGAVLPAERQGVAVIEPRGRAVATSGNYRRYRDTSSGRVGHIISPVTGRRVATEVLSATVVAADCITADALATACMAMEPERAMAMIEKIADADVLLVVADSIGPGEGWRLLTTSGFPEFR